MTKKNILWSSTAVFLLLLIFIITSCDVTDPQEGLEVRIKTKSRESIVNMFLKDAVDNSVVRRSTKVTFEGSNASKIIDINNNPATVFTTVSGNITFSIADGTSFDENSPFEVNVRVEATDHLPTVEKVRIYSKGVSTTTLFLTNPSNLPDNTYEGNVEGGSASNDGTVDTETKVTTDNGTSVTYPEGTQLATDQGQPLQGDLTTTVQTIPVDDNNLAPPSVSDGTTNGLPIVNLDIKVTDQFGNTADLSTTQKIVVEIPIDLSKINPATGQNYKVGDKFSAFEVSDNSGSGTKVGEGEIVNANDGPVIVIEIGGGPGPLAKVTDPAIVAGGVVVCADWDDSSDPCRVVLKSSQSEISSFSFEVFLDGRSKGTFSGNQFQSSGGVSFNNILTPANVELKYQGTPVFSGTVDCGDNNVSINLGVIPQTFTINLAASGVCTDRDPRVIGTLSDAAYSYYPTSNPSDVNTGVVVAGSGSVTLTPGEYTFTLTYDGEDYSGNVTINASGGIDHNGFDTENLYFGEIKINGVLTTLNASNNPNIQGTNVTVYISIDCDS